MGNYVPKAGIKGRDKYLRPAVSVGFNYLSLSLIPVIGGCFTNVSRALQNILSNFVYCRNRTSYANFKLTLCMCAQSHALCTRTKFQLEILTINVISGIVYFREIVSESSRKVSETTPWHTSLVFPSVYFEMVGMFRLRFAMLNSSFPKTVFESEDGENIESVHTRPNAWNSVALQVCHWQRVNVTLVAIAGIIILVLYLWIEPPKIIWRPGTRSWNQTWYKLVPLHYNDCTRIVSTVITAISNYIHYKVWDEIIYPFINFNGATVEV